MKARLFITAFAMLMGVGIKAQAAKTIHKIVKPDYVGIYNETMEIASVKTTEEATTVTFQYGGKGISFFDKGICIVDETGKRHELIGQKGFTEDSLKRLVLKKKGKYELRFKPLASDCRIFDIVEDFYSSSTRYYGVRQAGSEFCVSNPKEHNNGEASLPEVVFKVDTAYVSGKVENLDKDAQWKVSLIYDYADTNYGKKRKRASAMVDKEGNFKIKTRINGPTWDYLMVSSDKKQRNVMLVPVLLCPGEEQTLQIRFREDVKYDSNSQRDFGTLMQCAPMMLYKKYSYSKPKEYFMDDYNAMTPEKVKKQFDDYDRLSLYLSGKYGLSRVETELLRSQLSASFAIDMLFLANSNQHGTYYKGVPDEEWRKARGKWIESDSPFYGICFANMRCESNVYWAVTDRWLLFSGYLMGQIPPYAKRENDFQFYKWKTIFNREVEKSEDGGYEGITIAGTPENLKKVDDFDNKKIQLFYNWMLPLIREWRNKNGNDDLFEQIYLLSCIYSVPYIPYKSSKYIYDQFTLARQMIHHPSFCRLAGEMFFEIEKVIQQDYDEWETEWGKSKK